MTEPVSYMWKTERGTIIGFTPNDNSHSGGQLGIPLYTAEQLHPRVKMTKKQYKEWQSVIRSIYPVNLHELFNLIFNPSEHHGEYAGMRDIFSFNKGQKKLAQLWSDFDSDNPEELIEIVPDMKWFVRSKEQYQPDMDQGISESGYLYLTQGNIYSIEYYEMAPFKDEAQQFDTKDQAEKWTNPLTEAVQLPVEGE
ncbi:hypothetical protein L963_1364 [Leuconostoc mesenteroides subsp. cremoris T26]|nr:hypothetical protein L963_1364 [Leuconostoc mesenteroides subsp. cremoris T26]